MSPTVQGGVIRALSVSQAEQYDPEQTGGCPRRWYFERVEGRRPEKTTAHSDGDAGHELLALHLSGQQLPKRSRMLKAVRSAIDVGRLPTPGPDLLVERRFDRQPKRDATGTWVELDAAKTLWLGGVPWDGFVDLRYRRGYTVSIWDHKFSSDIHQYAKPSDSLIRTVQMPVYALDSLRIWPDARVFELVHHYVSRRGVDSFTRCQTVTLAQVLNRRDEIEGLVEQMKQAARATSAEAVPFNRRACTAYMGCPHQSICSAFKGKKMSLTAEELAIFGLTSGEVPAAEANDGGESAARAVKEETQRLAKQYHARSDADAFDIPLPTASAPAAQPPTCAKCGTGLHSENGSQRDGVWKHIGCPAEAAQFSPRSASEIRDAEALAAERGKPAYVGKLGAGAETCSECPHSAHEGRACGAPRGRGKCRCGAAVEVRPERPAPQAPVFEGEPDAAQVGGEPPEAPTSTPERIPAVTTLDDIEPLDDALARVPLIPNRVEVVVTVELGPSTLAFLAGLVRR